MWRKTSGFVSFLYQEKLYQSRGTIVFHVKDEAAGAHDILRRNGMMWGCYSSISPGRVV